jgi:hypothetical protein
MLAVEVLYADGTNAWIGHFGSVTSARQAILMHACITDLPTEEPWHGPDIGVLEGWFVGKDEYLIRQK